MFDISVTIGTIHNSTCECIYWVVLITQAAAENTSRSCTDNACLSCSFPKEYLVIISWFWACSSFVISNNASCSWSANWQKHLVCHTYCYQTQHCLWTVCLLVCEHFHNTLKVLKVCSCHFWVSYDLSRVEVLKGMHVSTDLSRYNWFKTHPVEVCCISPPPFWP